MRQRIILCQVLFFIFILCSAFVSGAGCLTKDELRQTIKKELESKNVPYTEELLDRYVEAASSQEEVPPSAERGFTTVETLLAFNPLTAPFYWGYKGIKKLFSFQRPQLLKQHSEESGLEALIIREQRLKDFPVGRTNPHIQSIADLVADAQYNEALLTLRQHQREMNPLEVSMLERYLYEKRPHPFGFSDKNDYRLFGGRIHEIIESLNFKNYNPKKVFLTGSSVTGISAKTGKLYAEGRDVDITVLIDQKQYDGLVETIEEKLFEGRERDRYQQTRQYRDFRKEVAKGKISKQWLQLVSPSRTLTSKLNSFALERGISDIDLSFVLKGSGFDTGEYMVLTTISGR